MLCVSFCSPFLRHEFKWKSFYHKKICFTVIWDSTSSLRCPFEKSQKINRFQLFFSRINQTHAISNSFSFLRATKKKSGEKWSKSTAKRMYSELEMPHLCLNLYSQYNGFKVFYFLISAHHLLEFRLGGSIAFDMRNVQSRRKKLYSHYTVIIIYYIVACGSYFMWFEIHQIDRNVYAG